MDFLYALSLSLWVGGMGIFTFVVTPAIFRSYGRDQAGEIVGRLFPGYFAYTLAMSAVALVLCFLLKVDPADRMHRISLALLAAALVVNLYVTFKIHPDAVRIKQEIASFESESPDSPARSKFRRLHAVSAVLNLFVLVDGVVLLALSRNIGR